MIQCDSSFLLLIYCVDISWEDSEEYAEFLYRPGIMPR